eukprot:5995996-Prymnesium_polylepis.1
MRPILALIFQRMVSKTQCFRCTECERVARRDPPAWRCACSAGPSARGLAGARSPHEIAPIPNGNADRARTRPRLLFV